MLECNGHQTDLHDINLGGQNENFSSLKMHQREEVCTFSSKAPAPYSYITSLGALKGDNTKGLRTGKKEAVLPTVQAARVAEPQSEYCRTLMVQQAPTADPPAAPQRLRIRRRSMRQETVELLAMLDDLLHRPASQSGKAP